jgi:hypothetical protein
MFCSVLFYEKHGQPVSAVAAYAPGMDEVGIASHKASRRASLLYSGVLSAHEQSVSSIRLTQCVHCCCLAGLLLQLVWMLLVRCSSCLSTGQS